MRKEPNTSADIVGKLMGDSACEILDSTQEGWYKISSGGIEGYIDSQYVLTGDEAKTKAYELVTLRAIDLPVSVETKRRVSYLPDKNYLNDGLRINQILDYFHDFYDNN